MHRSIPCCAQLIRAHSFACSSCAQIVATTRTRLLMPTSSTLALVTCGFQRSLAFAFSRFHVRSEHAPHRCVFFPLDRYGGCGQHLHQRNHPLRCRTNASVAVCLRGALCTSPNERISAVNGLHLDLGDHLVHDVRHTVPDTTVFPANCTATLPIGAAATASSRHVACRPSNLSKQTPPNHCSLRCDAAASTPAPP